MDYVIEEYIDEEFLMVYEESQEKSKQESKKDDFSENGYLTKEEHMFAVETGRRGLKRKEADSRTKTQPQDHEPWTIGGNIKLYAYKGCLGKYDSLIKNPDIVLWYRDNKFLLQKFLRKSCNDNGLFYHSTNTYSCWDDRRASQYMEIEALILRKESQNLSVKILDVEKIEQKCMEGNFKLLRLQPYVNHEMVPSKKLSNPKRPATSTATSNEGSTYPENVSNLNDENAA